MPDISVPFTLTTPGGTIVFNDGSDDQFHIQEISGLSGAPIRAPQDDKPYGDGGIGHNFWKGARHIVIDGVFLILSVPCGFEMAEIRNDMEEDLRVALESMLLTVDAGTLAWTPNGQSARSLAVRCEVPLECPHEQNYLLRSFHFGLYAETPDWA